MDKFKKITTILTFILLLSLSACNLPNNPRIQAEIRATKEAAVITALPKEGEWKLSDLEGNWSDVNGNTKLNFQNDIMIIDRGSEKITYKVRITDAQTQSVENDDPNNSDFGVMTSMKIGYDGALTAYDTALDAEGHKYRFVRDELLAKEKAVQDLSKNLPKAIFSDEIENFSLDFWLGESRYDIPENEVKWEDGMYSFHITRATDKSYTLDFQAYGPSHVIKSFTGPVTDDYMKTLAKIIQELYIPRNNGYNKKNNEDFHPWSLFVEYTTGETLELSASGRPALECPFSIYVLLEYANIAIR